MTNIKVLFIGGTGIISSACSDLALARGIDLYLLNRGQSRRPLPAGAHVLQADARDAAAMDEALGDMQFDAVVNWIAFTPAHVEQDIARFAGRTAQYIFISSASAYQTPPTFLPIRESTPLANPVWAYSQAKIACEERLLAAYREQGFPVTIVRPSHTYDRTLLPFHGRYTIVDRMRRGQPVIVHGDGTSLWTLTHHRDFAKGFVPLLGDARARGEAFHITSDEWLTWDQIFRAVAEAAGVDEPNLLHMPSELIAEYDRAWGDGLLGDKMHSAIFDNSKIKRLVPDFACTIPFSQGAREIMAWYDADPARQVVDSDFDLKLDLMIARYRSARP